MNSHIVQFDTLASVKKLIGAGFTEKQAEAQIEILAQLVDEQLVTKQYLDLTLELRLSQTKVEIIKWVAGMLIAQAVIIAALVKLL
jgi:hypothetical protein